MSATEWFLRKRAIVILLGMFLLLSLISLGSRIYPDPSENSLASDDKSNLTSVGPAVAATPAENDEPEEEDLVQVETKPTNEDEFVPKVFDAPSQAMQAIIDKNVMKHNKDRILLTAVANGGMADYTLNWIASLKRTKLDAHFLVFAIDKELDDILTENGFGDHVVRIPEDWFHQKLDSGMAKWLDKNYTPITHSKSLVVERLLYMGVTVWFSDVDIVFTSDTIYDYLRMKLDSRKSTEMLFTQETEQRILNSGFYIMRPTLTSKRILADSITIQDNEPKVTQQRAMNRIIDDMDLNYQYSKVALLDLSLFPHGRMYFERQIPTKYGMVPMMVHANYRIGDEKKKSLQKAGLWYI
ncbi:unnamed protein product [Absidia cylindrospora]